MLTTSHPGILLKFLATLGPQYPKPRTPIRIIDVTVALLEAAKGMALV
jgi:hypothetical protein